MNVKKMKAIMILSLVVTGIAIIFQSVMNCVYREYSPDTYSEFSWSFWIVYFGIILFTVYPVWRLTNYYLRPLIPWQGEGLLCRDEFLGMVRISFGSTIVSTMSMCMFVGPRIYAEHTFMYWVIYFCIMLLAVCPMVFMIMRYVALPWIEKYKHKN